MRESLPIRCHRAARCREPRQDGLDKGVADGIRTRDHRDHNPGLYQLSYRHRARAG